MFLPTFSFAFRMFMRVINGDTESELSKCIVWNRRTCCQVIRTKLERVSSFFIVLSTCRFARTHRYIYCKLKKSCETWNMEACQALIQCKFCLRVQKNSRAEYFDCCSFELSECSSPYVSCLGVACHVWTSLHFACVIYWHISCESVNFSVMRDSVWIRWFLWQLLKSYSAVDTCT